MPNWVNNQLVIKGEKATLEEIAKKGKPTYTVPPTVVINYFDDNEELLEILKQSTDEGDWEYDEKAEKFSFKK